MSAAPRVSVVMPAYNAARFIGASIESVLAQRHAALELLVVDDASTDESRSIAAGYTRDPRVRVLDNARRKGPSGARNTALLAATGDYVGFLDSDDLWGPDHLEHAMGFLEAHPEIDVVMFDFDIVDVASGRRLGNWFAERRFATALESRELGDGYRLVVADMFEALVGEAFAHLQALVVRRRAVEGILFSETLMRSEDRDFAIRICAERGARFAFHPRVTGTYHRHPGSLTAGSAQANEATAVDEVRLFGTYLERDDLSAALRANLHRKLAHRLMEIAYYRRKAGDPAAAWDRAMASLRHEVRPRQFLELAKIAASRLRGG